MTNFAIQYQHKTPPLMVSIPAEGGVFGLRAMAFAAILATFSSTSSQATTIGSARMTPGSSMASDFADRQNCDLKVAAALDEIKQRSGLTWGQLATLFEVSRQTVHSWASGSPTRIVHSGRVNELLEKVRSLSGLPAFKVREVLLGLSKTQSNYELQSGGEPPILLSDNAPFVHQLELRPSKTKVKRG